MTEELHFKFHFILINLNFNNCMRLAATVLVSAVLDVSRDNVAKSHTVAFNISFIYTFKNHAVPWLLKKYLEVELISVCIK